MRCNVCDSESVDDTCKCTCKACGVGLTPRVPGTRGPSRKYCMYCRDNRLRKMATDRVCLWCGATYWTSSTPRKKGRGRLVSCSDRCLNNYTTYGKTYGLTEQSLTALRESQGNRCAICGNDERLVVDHDHTTGEVRELLCHGCNVTLGFMMENPESLRKAPLTTLISGHGLSSSDKGCHRSRCTRCSPIRHLDETSERSDRSQSPCSDGRSRK